MVARARADQLDARVRPVAEASGVLARAARRDEGRQGHHRRTSAPPTSRGCARIRTVKWRCRPPRSSTRCRRPQRPKGDVIAALLPEVEKPGDAAKGRALFTGTCASCHKLGDLGKSEVGPPLNGMGAHGRAELLGHIIDPEPRSRSQFLAVERDDQEGRNARRRDRERERRQPHASQPGRRRRDKKEDIATRENTRRSLMPEGLEALGAESLRDILSFSPPAMRRSSASSICVRPTRRTAVAASAARTNATRRSRCTSSATSTSRACRSSSWIRPSRPMAPT